MAMCCRECKWWKSATEHMGGCHLNPKVEPKAGEDFCSNFKSKILNEVKSCGWPIRS